MLPAAGMTALLLVAGCGRQPVARPTELATPPPVDSPAIAPTAPLATVSGQSAPSPAVALGMATAAPPATVAMPTATPARATRAPTAAPAPAPTLPLIATATATAPLPAPPIEKFITLAARDLAGRLSITVDQIVTLDAVAIIWPDAALGCPRPGKVYPRGRVPGFKIVLGAQGQQYDYHTDQAGQIVLCQAETPDSGAGNGPQVGVPIP
jgi:hypothetical protein